MVADLVHSGGHFGVNFGPNFGRFLDQFSAVFCIPVLKASRTSERLVFEPISDKKTAIFIERVIKFSVFRLSVEGRWQKSFWVRFLTILGPNIDPKRCKNKPF